MRYYLVYLIITDGDKEVYKEVTAQGQSETRVLAVAHKRCEGWFDGEVCLMSVKCEGVQEITHTEYVVLNEYLGDLAED